MPDGYADIMDRWTLKDLQDAHLLIDEIEAARAREAAKDQA